MTDYHQPDATESHKRWKTELEETSTWLRLEKQAHKFSAAHTTLFGGGIKERLHGHNYQVSLDLELMPNGKLDHSDSSSSVTNHQAGATSKGCDPFVDFRVFKEACAHVCALWDEKILIATQHPDVTITQSPNVPETTEVCVYEASYRFPSEEVVLLSIGNVTVEELSREFCYRYLELLDAQDAVRHLRSLRVHIAETLGQGATFSARLPVQNPQKSHQ